MAVRLGLLLCLLPGLHRGPRWAADTNGFVLPMPGGLPSRIHCAGRDYAICAVCAGAGWRNDRAPMCRSGAELRAHGD